VSLVRPPINPLINPAALEQNPDVRTCDRLAPLVANVEIFTGLGIFSGIQAL
jgi:hypothetical protein